LCCCIGVGLRLTFHYLRHTIIEQSNMVSSGEAGENPALSRNCKLVSWFGSSVVM